MKSKVLEELKKSFKPEFLNRIDEVIVFHSLTKEALYKIVKIMMDEINERIASKGIAVELTQKAIELISEKGYDPKFGARPLRRVIENSIEEPLSDGLLRGDFAQGDTVKADAKDGAIVLEKAAKKKPRKKAPEKIAA